MHETKLGYILALLKSNPLRENKRFKNNNGMDISETIVDEKMAGRLNSTPFYKIFQE
jgi:hypothetical protein